MYKIDTNVDKPDILWMRDKVKELMERGIKIKPCTELLNMYKEDMERIKDVIINKYNILNPNSNPQIVSYLQFRSDKIVYGEVNDILNYCYDIRSKKWSSAASGLEKLAELGYDFAADILEYRHVKKYHDSINGLLSARDKDGYVHPSISLAKTNRLNYKEPGVMTIPKEMLWDIVGAIHEGNSVFSVDIKNQEPHILISATGADDLKDALEAEEGLYEAVFRKCFRPIVTANIVYDLFTDNKVYSIEEIEKVGIVSPALYLPEKPFVKDTYYNGERIKAIETICIGSEKGFDVRNILPEKISIETESGTIYEVGVDWQIDGKEKNRKSDYKITGLLKGVTVEIGHRERNEFKISWNALSYGGSMQVIKESCKNIDPIQTYNYLTKIEQIKNYNKMIEKRARDGERMINTVFGTCIDAGWTKDWRELKRILLDIPIQGTGADILALLIERFYDYIDEHNIKDYFELVYTRNDELVIEVDKDYIKEHGLENVDNILKDMLEHQINDWVPFKIEIKKVI